MNVHSDSMLEKGVLAILMKGPELLLNKMNEKIGYQSNSSI